MTVVLFSFLAGMFKALRDRDLWGALSQEDGVELWYERNRFYRAWSDTEKYLGPFPLDFWHNADLVVMASAYVAGRGALDWSLVWFFAVALPTKAVTYHFLVMKRPLVELRAQWEEWKQLNAWLLAFIQKLFR
jgi:hypothetical protein